MMNVACKKLVRKIGPFLNLKVDVENFVPALDTANNRR